MALTLGGRPGILSMDLVRSAIGRPYTGYYRPIYKKAAVIVQSLAGNHGFTDGNKRTALIVLNAFLLRSGFELAGMTNEQLNDTLEEMILAAADGRFDLEEGYRWFRQHLRLREGSP